MYTLTSSTTKVAILVLSAGLSWSAFDAVTLGFQAQTRTMPSVELPTVVVIGYRASVVPDTVQAAAKVEGRSSI
jgi:hypothetical protein